VRWSIRTRSAFRSKASGCYFDFDQKPRRGMLCGTPADGDGDQASSRHFAGGVQGLNARFTGISSDRNVSEGHWHTPSLLFEQL